MQWNIAVHKMSGPLKLPLVYKPWLPWYTNIEKRTFLISNKCSVLHRQSRNINQNIKWSNVSSIGPSSERNQYQVRTAGEKAKFCAVHRNCKFKMDYRLVLTPVMLFYANSHNLCLIYNIQFMFKKPFYIKILY